MGENTMKGGVPVWWRSEIYRGWRPDLGIVSCLGKTFTLASHLVVDLSQTLPTSPKQHQVHGLGLTSKALFSECDQVITRLPG